MVTKLVKEIPTLVGKISKIESIETSELNLLNGLIDAFEDIRLQILNGSSDVGVEQSLTQIRDVLENTLDHIKKREKVRECIKNAKK